MPVGEGLGGVVVCVCSHLISLPKGLLALFWASKVGKAKMCMAAWGVVSTEDFTGEVGDR